MRTAPSEASNQSAMPVGVAESVEVEKRQSGPRYWAQYRGVFGQVLPLGSDYKIDCPTGFWGEKVRYDWQMYGYALLRWEAPVQAKAEMSGYVISHDDDAMIYSHTSVVD